MKMYEETFFATLLVDKSVCVPEVLFLFPFLSHFDSCCSKFSTEKRETVVSKYIGKSILY